MTHRGIFETKPLNSITLDGTVIDATKAGSAATIQVLMYDRDKKALFCQGTGVPTNDTNGYAKGCIFIDTDVAKGTGGMYVNKGSKTECTFSLVTQA